MKTATAMAVILVLVAILVAACAKGNITGHVVQQTDSSLGSEPNSQADNQSSAGCVMDRQALGSIFSGRSSL